jgi:L-lactate dehydrogenase (cytochrome)
MDSVTPPAPPPVVARAKKNVPAKVARYLALDDFEPAARRLLPRLVHGYIAGAAERGAAFRNAQDEFARYAFVPRVLANVAARDLGKSLFGISYDAPFGIAPMGVTALAAYRGDLVLARAAAAANIPMICSATSLIKLEEVRAAGPTSWFQAYLAGDEARIIPMVDRVQAAGFDTFVITADVPVGANRENNIRNGYTVPLVMTPKVIWDMATHPRWLISIWGQTYYRHGMPHFENMDATRGPPLVSKDLERNIGKRDQLAWEHVALIRRRFRGRVLVKGLLSAMDARIAREQGVDGIIVSNHGGRQLDGAIGPLAVLPEIRAAVGDLPLMLDGAIRRGTDVLKALALGADFVFIGRPFLYAAAVAGADGANRVIGLMREEIDRDMALLGIRSLDALAPEMLRKLG